MRTELLKIHTFLQFKLVKKVVKFIIIIIIVYTILIIKKSYI